MVWSSESGVPSRGRYWRWRNRCGWNGYRELDVEIVDGKCRLCLREDETVEKV